VKEIVLWKFSFRQGNSQFTLSSV